MAAITDYSSLQTEIASWLHRTDLTTTIQGIISLAEARIYRELRVRQMETALSSTISSGIIAVPTGYLELKYAYIDGSPVRRLQRKDAEWIYTAFPTRSSDGKPLYIARDGTNFIFGPYPDSTYTVKGSYYKKLDALSGSNTSNWLTTDVPDLILFASLCECAPYIGDDDRIVLWEQKYAQIKDRVQRKNDEEDFSGSPMAVVGR